MDFCSAIRALLSPRVSAKVGSARVGLWLIASLAVFLTSCSEEEIKNVTQRVAQVQQAVESVSPVTDGDISLGPAPQIKVEKCWARFFPPEDGRAGVIQLASYADPAAETYPAVFFRAVVRAKTVGELSGKPVAGELYIQERKDGDVLSTSWENPPECTISAAGEWSITIDFKELPLSSALDGKQAKITGKMVGSLTHDK